MIQNLKEFYSDSLSKFSTWNSTESNVIQVLKMLSEHLLHLYSNHTLRTFNIG